MPRWSSLRRLLACIVLFVWVTSHSLDAMAATAPPYAPTLTGRAVSFTLSGLEPDFDPLYRVIIAAMLHDVRQGGVAVPDAMLVLSAYLEVFQPATTPLLPDLLHPNQVAASLDGFLQGKAALVSAAGQIVARGSLLAEIFSGNTVHIVLRLYPVKAPTTTAPLHLQGMFTLYKNKTQQGWLRADGPSSVIAALSVPRGHLPSWQAVLNGLSVRPPPMMGTRAVHPAPHATPTPSGYATVTAAVSRGVPGVAAGLSVIALMMVVWWVSRRYRRRRARVGIGPW